MKEKAVISWNIVLLLPLIATGCTSQSAVSAAPPLLGRAEQTQGVAQMESEETESIAANEIRELILQRAEAMRRHDADALTRDFSPSATVFEMIPPLRLSAGAASNQGSVRAWLASWRELQVEIRDLEIRASGNIAFAYSLNRLTGTQVSGRAVDIWMRSTMGFERTQAGWTIVHAHTSVPFHPNSSLKAALDLKPE